MWVSSDMQWCHQTCLDVTGHALVSLDMHWCKQGTGQRSTRPPPPACPRQLALPGRGSLWATRCTSPRPPKPCGPLQRQTWLLSRMERACSCWKPGRAVSWAPYLSKQVRHSQACPSPLLAHLAHPAFCCLGCVMVIGDLCRYRVFAIAMCHADV